MDIVAYILSKKYTNKVLAGLSGVGKDGVTFFPKVLDGILSWTNNGDLENPTPVKISGENGKSATIKIGEVTTLPPTENATVTNVGTETDAVLDFGIPKGESSGGSDFSIGEGLILNKETNTLSVDVSNKIEQDNTKPITSGAVYTEIGNINALLSTI